MSRINKNSRLLTHTASSLNRQLRTMEQHPSAFEPRVSPRVARSVEVHSSVARVTATKMNKTLETSTISSSEKRQAMTFAFSEHGSAPPSSRTFRVVPDTKKPGEAALSRMMPSIPSDLIAKDRAMPKPSTRELNSWAWRDASVSSVGGQHHKNATRIEVEARALGKKSIALAAFESADHHAKSGFKHVNLVQPEDTGKGIIQNPVMVKRISAIKIGPIPRPIK